VSPTAITPLPPADFKLGDFQVHIPSDLGSSTGDFDFTKSKGFILRVSGDPPRFQPRCRRTVNDLPRGHGPRRPELRRGARRSRVRYEQEPGPAVGQLAPAT
jgi:hypothetical protein